MVFLKRYWAYIALVLLVAGTHFGAYRHGVTTEHDRLSLEVAQDQRRIALEHAQVLSDLRVSDRAAQARADALALALSTERKKNAAEVADLQRALAVGAVRVFVPAGDSTGRVSAEAPVDSGGAESRGACELPAVTAGNLVGLAGRADDLALKYNRLLDFTRGLTCEVQHE